MNTLWKTKLSKWPQWCIFDIIICLKKLTKCRNEFQVFIDMIQIIIFWSLKCTLTPESLLRSFLQCLWTSDQKKWLQQISSRKWKCEQNSTYESIVLMISVTQVYIDPDSLLRSFLLCLWTWAWKLSKITLHLCGSHYISITRHCL